MINNPYIYNQMPGYQQPQDMQRVNPYMRGFPQPPSVPLGLPGKYIQNLNDVVVSEVPQDGSVAFFPTSDFSKIYAKAWTADGKIQTEEYVLQKSIKEPNFQEDIMERLERIEGMLSFLPKKNTKKKEADTDD